MTNTLNSNILFSAETYNIPYYQQDFGNIIPFTISTYWSALGFENKAYFPAPPRWTSHYHCPPLAFRQGYTQ